MTARLLAFVIWAAVAASAAFWGLTLLVRSPSLPRQTQVVDTVAPARGDLARLFGAAPVALSADSGATAPGTERFRLVGVVAPRPQTPGQGVALLAVDGRPARAFRVGAAVDGEWVLQAVRAKGASLGPRGAPAQIELSLPDLPPPATGSMPAPPMPGAYTPQPSGAGTPEAGPM